MAEGYVTLKDLKAKRSDISYQRLNRAVRALRKAGLISTWRGQRNELRIREEHERYVWYLFRKMREDYGLDKAIAFFRAQRNKEEIQELKAQYKKLLAENRQLRQELGLPDSPTEEGVQQLLRYRTS